MPFRLLLGFDATQIIRKKLNAQPKKLEAWEKVSLTTDFSDI